MKSKANEKKKEHCMVKYRGEREVCNYRHTTSSPAKRWQGKEKYSIM
jgi:hypothetical protein